MSPALTCFLLCSLTINHTFSLVGMHLGFFGFDPHNLASGKNTMSTQARISGRLLWTPSAEKIQNSNLYDFARSVNKNTHFDWEEDYDRLWNWSVNVPAQFWSELWDWHGIIGEKGPIEIAHEKEMPGAKFFPKASVNYAENMLADADDSLAFIGYGEDGRCTRLTRAELKEKALALAGWMKAQNIGKGDRVAAYVPNCEIALIAMLATASIGAIFSSCSPDFGITGVSDRFSQIEPKLLITVDGYQYNGKPIDRLESLNTLIEQLPSLSCVLVAGYLDEKPDLAGIPAASSFEDALTHIPVTGFEAMNFNDPLYILYSSGTTGAPKCITHSIGGTLVQHIKEHRLHCDIQQGDVIFYFTTCGWMMWNWLVSAMLSKATILVYEGSPFYPGPECLWQIAEKEKVSLFGTSAKYIDALKKAEVYPAHIADLSALKTLCSTGSPLSEEGFDFIYQHISPNLHLASISGGTDLMACFVLGCPIKPVYAGEIQVRGLGMNVQILNDAATAVTEEQGELCCITPFPSMPVCFWGDDENDSKYKEAYFSTFDNIWRHGDWATLTERGGVVIHGRSDATLNPGGVRIGTAEIYRIVEEFTEIAEALVIGQNYENDTRIILFVRLAANAILSDDLQHRLKQEIRKKASPRHVPAVIATVTDIPRTRSGKITELAVRDVVHGRPVKNTEALSNPESLEEFRDRKELR